MIYNSHKQNGFSLVETLVAVSILLIVIVAPMTISSKTSKSSTFATEQVQAFFLAQEGLELAQAARNDFQLQYFQNPSANFAAWDAFTDPSGAFDFCYSDDGDSGCGLEWDVTSAGDDQIRVVDCNGSGQTCKLYLSPDDNRSRFTYNSSGNEEQLFTRKIYFYTLPASEDREVRVRSEVTWRTGSLVTDQVVTVETYLFNTYDND